LKWPTIRPTFEGKKKEANESDYWEIPQKRQETELIELQTTVMYALLMVA
jgi:hypothetical protein